MRAEPSVLHLDLDAFFASVEQRDKPSLRGRPVVVGGLGPRGVVSTASYEARVLGVHSAMPMGEARRRAPHAAYLTGRFAAYRAVSAIVMTVLRELSPLVEPLSLDEAFVDLAAGTGHDLSVEGVRAIGAAVRAEIHDRTGLTASVGAASSKLLAKLASDLDKPDGLLVVPPGDELSVLHPLPILRLWGVGPVTGQRLARIGVRTIGDLAALAPAELVDLFGQANGIGLHRLANGIDERPVVAAREAKSIGAEETFDADVVDRSRLRAELEQLMARTLRRLTSTGHSARTVTLKIRYPDFRTLTRSSTLPAPTDEAGVLLRAARSLLAAADVVGGIRLLGVALSGLSEQVQGEIPDLIEEPSPSAAALPPDRGLTSSPPTGSTPAAPSPYLPGIDVEHDQFGRGWVQGAGVGRVTVRFETARTTAGPVRTFSLADPELRVVPPLAT